MQNWKPLIEAVQMANRDGVRFAVATVVRVIGSAYRRPGARMVIREDGTSVGTISGGCLEKDVCLRTKELLKTLEPALLQYGTSGSDDDVVFGVGGGCNGTVEILVEPFDAASPIDTIALLEESERSRTPKILATVFKATGRKSHADSSPTVPTEMGNACALSLNHSTDDCATNETSDEVSNKLPKIGAKALVSPSSPIISTISDYTLLSQITRAAHEQLMQFQATSNSTTSENCVQFEVEGGSVDVCFELLLPAIQLVIHGNGSDAKCLEALARTFGWSVITTESVDAEDLLNRSDFSQRTAVVVMSHNYDRDLKFLRGVLPRECKYLGLLGPKHRTEKLLQELMVEGIDIPETTRARIFSPVGLDLGGDNEQEVALCIVAEITAVMHGRSGGFLRERKAGIHQQASSIDALSREIVPLRWLE